jgi:hypothetical protein
MIVDVQNRIIKEYKQFLERLEQGYRDDYSHILDMICFVEAIDDLSRTKYIY